MGSAPGFDRNHRDQLVNTLNDATHSGHEAALHDLSAMPPSKHTFPSDSDSCLRTEKHATSAPKESFLLICINGVTHAHVARLWKQARSICESGLSNSGSVCLARCLYGDPRHFRILLLHQRIMQRSCGCGEYARDRITSSTTFGLRVELLNWFRCADSG